MTKIRIR